MTSTPFGVQVQKYFLNNFLKSQCEQFFNDETPRVCGSAHDGCWCWTSITHIVWRHWYFHGLNLEWSGKISYRTGLPFSKYSICWVEHLTDERSLVNSQCRIVGITISSFCPDITESMLPLHDMTTWQINSITSNPTIPTSIIIHY